MAELTTEQKKAIAIANARKRAAEPDSNVTEAQKPPANETQMGVGEDVARSAGAGLARGAAMIRQVLGDPNAEGSADEHDHKLEDLPQHEPKIGATGNRDNDRHALQTRPIR